MNTTPTKPTTSVSEIYEFIQEFLETARNLRTDQLREPAMSRSTREDCIGILPEDLRGFATMLLIARDVLASQEGTHRRLVCLESVKSQSFIEKCSDTGSALLRSFSKIFVTREEMQAIEVMFWLGVRKAYPNECAKVDLTGRELTIRKGWEIVAKLKIPEVRIVLTTSSAPPCETFLGSTKWPPGSIGARASESAPSESGGA